MKLPEDMFTIFKFGEDAVDDNVIEAIVRDCAKVAADDMRRSGESSVVASLATAVERAILTRYGLKG